MHTAVAALIPFWWLSLRPPRKLMERTAGEIEASWRAVEPFLKAWAKAGRVHAYAAGTAGPRAADAMLARDGRAWRELGK